MSRPMFQPAARNSLPQGHLVSFHFLGSIDFDACLALQTRLVYESGGHDDGRITVLLCEHPPLITLGRSGSRRHIRLSQQQLDRNCLEVRYVSRGGGAVLHQPGQLAVYPIVPLEQRSWNVGEYLARLQTGLAAAVRSVGVRSEEDSFLLRGRTGILANIGAAVRNWTTFHGAWLNVAPPLEHAPRIDLLPPESAGVAKTTMSSLLAERREPVTMPKVRAALVEHLAAAFDCPRQHVHSGHPLHRACTRVA